MAIDWADPKTTGGIISVIVAILGGIAKLVHGSKTKKAEASPQAIFNAQIETELVYIREQIKELFEQNKKDMETREMIIQNAERVKTLLKDVDRLRGDIAELYGLTRGLKKD